MVKERLAKILHWLGFILSAVVLLLVAAATFSVMEVALPFLVALIPFILAVFIKRKLTGEKSIWPWIKK